MGNIEKRGANSWRIGEQISTDEGRAWIRRSLKFPSDMSEAEQRAQAEIALARLIVDIADGRAVPSTSYTVETFAHLWLEDYVRPNLSPNYYTTLENMLRLRIIPALGDVRLDKLTPIALTRFISGLKNEDKKTTALPPEQRKRKATQYEIDQYKDAKPQKLSNRTIKSYYDCLNSMLDKAVQWEKLSRNPMDKVDAP
ncbi:MAG: N-terminal phage integrase SAM-like domain-containing protein, partial [Clostridia bacterium]